MTTSRSSRRGVLLLLLLSLSGCVERESVTLIVPAGRLGGVDA